ncbi:MAG TPA: ABC transporter permease [Actinobacteria bacterium]|nr:ABC transporter permease [Actinomycetota bacterium]
MFAYTVRRLLHSIPVLILASLVVFILMQYAGDPLARLRLNPHVTPQDIERLEKEMGLDKPLWARYARWSGDFVRGDWGESMSHHRPVLELIVERMKNTLQLMSAALLFTFILAIPIGIYSAVRQYSKFDYAATFFSFLGFSMPIFWFGLILQMILGYYLTRALGFQLFYTASMYSVGKEYDLINRLQHLALPTITLSLAYIAGWSRYQRSSMLEVIRADYLRTAHAKGLSESKVILKHALRNALIPVITVIMLDMPALFGGAVITEYIFAWPGIGRLLHYGILNGDYFLVMGIVMVSAFLVIFFNLLADILYGFLDPRIAYK